MHMDSIFSIFMKYIRAYLQKQWQDTCLNLIGTLYSHCDFTAVATSYTENYISAAISNTELCEHNILLNCYMLYRKTK